MITVSIQVIGEKRVRVQMVASKWLAALLILAMAMYTKELFFYIYKEQAFLITGSVKDRRIKINNPSHSIKNTFKRAILVMNRELQKECERHAV